MHLTAFIINGCILLKASCHRLIVNDNLVLADRCTYDDFKYIQKLSRITCTITEESIGLNDLDSAVGEYFILLYGPVKKLLKILLCKRLKDKDLTS